MNENSKGFDLFGNEVYLVPRKRGRPKFEWTAENAKKVSMLLAMGWNNARIANCILDPRTGKPISEPTLKRYFRAELAARDFARDRLTARRLEQVWQQCEKGNLAAQKQLDKMIEKNDLMSIGRRMDEKQAKGRNGGTAVSNQKLGKKEAAQRAAQESADGTEWGTDLDLPGFRAN